MLPNFWHSFSTPFDWMTRSSIGFPHDGRRCGAGGHGRLCRWSWYRDSCVWAPRILRHVRRGMRSRMVCSGVGARRRYRRRRGRAGYAGRRGRDPSRRSAARDRRSPEYRRSPMSSAVLHASGRRSETLRYTTLRLGTREVIDVRVAPVPTRSRRALLRARGRRDLHAPRGRGGQAAAAARSGHASLLLARRRVLRRLHLLIQRAARPARLGVLLGGCHLDSGLAAHVPPFHDGVPGAPAAVERRTGRARDRAGRLLAGRGARARAHRRVARSASDAAKLRPHDYRARAPRVPVLWRRV